jgi:hypothetical protein
MKLLFYGFNYWSLVNDTRKNPFEFFQKRKCLLNIENVILTMCTASSETGLYFYAKAVCVVTFQPHSMLFKKSRANLFICNILSFLYRVKLFETCFTNQLWNTSKKFTKCSYTLLKSGLCLDDNQMIWRL